MEKIDKLRNFKFSKQGIDLLKQIAVTFTIVFFLGFGFTHTLTNYRILVFFAILLTTLGGVWLIARQKAATPLKPFLFLWLAAYAISVILSIDPRRSITQMSLMLIGVFLFLLSYDLVSRGWKLNWFLKSFVIAGVLNIIFNLNEAGTWYLNWITLNPGQWIPTINFRLATLNLMAPFMYLVFHMALPLLIKSKKNIIKILLGCIIFLAMLVLYLTSSRGGWLGMFFGLMTWILYLLFEYKSLVFNYIQKLWERKLLFAGSIIVLLGIATVGGILLFNKAVHPTHGSIFNSRAGLWGPAITAFKQNPIFGQGQYTYGSAFLLEHSAPPTNVYVHPHGLYHNLLGEMGIVGFVVAIVFSIAYVRKFKISFRQSNQKIYLLGILAYCVSFFIHSIFDSFNFEVSLFWPLTILTGAAIAQPLGLSKTPSAGRPWWVLILIGFVWFGIWTITPHYQGVALANQTQWQLAYEKFQTAVERDPANAVSHQQLALTAAVLAENGDASKLDDAIAALQKTIQHEPSWALNHANLAALYRSSNQLELAVAAAQRSVALAPGAPLYSLNLGSILEQKGDTEKAKAAYLQALTLSPDWASAAFWDETEVRKSFITAWRNDHPREESISLDEATRIWQDNQQFSWAYNQLAVELLKQGELERAKHLLDNARLAYKNSAFDSIETEWLQAEYYALMGDYQKAVEMGSQALRKYHFYGVYGPGTFGMLPYTPWMFRMNAMALEIVPQMVDVPIPAIWLERANLLKSWQEQVQ